MRNALATYYIDSKSIAVFCVNVDKNSNFIFLLYYYPKNKSEMLYCIYVIIGF